MLQLTTEQTGNSNEARGHKQTHLRWGHGAVEEEEGSPRWRAGCSRDVAVPSHFVPSQQCRKYGTAATVPVQKAELVSACEALGVSTEGTREDILNRLQELLLYKDIYPKMFVKLQKAGAVLFAEEKEEQLTTIRIANSTANLHDLKSLCPPEIMCTEQRSTGKVRMSWLTDSVVDTRLSQLVEGTENVILIPTFNFILLWRDWQKNKAIQDVHLKCIKEVKENSKVLIPRVVGHKTPESGNHFILWASIVFDGLTSEIRLYDSLGKNKTIESQDMELLCNAFQNI
ncbi:hypothetical protein SRHO_G00307060 [Serrasalmus rhombeus]